MIMMILLLTGSQKNSDDKTSRLFAARYTNGTWESTQQIVDAQNQDIYYLKLEKISDNSVIAIWQNTEEICLHPEPIDFCQIRSLEIMSRVFEPSQGWLPPQIVNDQASNTRSFGFGLDGAGHGIALWSTGSPQFGIKFSIFK